MEGIGDNGLLKKELFANFDDDNGAYGELDQERALSADFSGFTEYTVPFTVICLLKKVKNMIALIFHESKN